MAEIKLCRDCKFVKRDWVFTILPPWNGFEFAKCIHPSSISVDGLVDGKQSNFCSTERLFRCGKEARNFQPK